MRFVAAIGGSILLQDYDARRFQEYAEIEQEKQNAMILE